MIINHNTSALNTLNKLNKNNKNAASAMGKLSSGLRINKASDDSAGLAISEKMRAQIRGLQQAQSNTQDGISLIQTAEGGLKTIQDPNLLRLKELAVQSANDTLTNEDRQQIQKEVDQLKKGINGIANNTEFNGIKLLNVEENTTQEITQTTMQPVTETITTTVPAYASSTSTVEITQAQSITIFEYTDGIVNEKTYSISELLAGQNYSPPNNSNEVYYFSVSNINAGGVTGNFTSSSYATYGEARNNITGIRLNGLTGYDETELWGAILGYGNTSGFDPTSSHPITNAFGNDLSDYPEFAPGEPSGNQINFRFLARKQTGTTTQTVTQTTMQPITSTTQQDVPNPPLSFQIGANSGDTFQVELTDVRTTALGIDDINLSTKQGAEFAILKIDQAMERVSLERGKFGAYQNRLEHSLNNASNYEINLTASESRIRDADIAKQTMEMTKSQILSQASQVMLSQGNQKPQQVIQLISG
jgi:flagellin